MIIPLGKIIKIIKSQIKFFKNMKNSTLVSKMLCSAVICGLIFAGCGGGSGSSSGSKSGGGSSKSAVLGSIPAIYKDFNAKMVALEEKGKTAKDMDALVKLRAEGNALVKKADEALLAELKKIEGKEVPVSFSKALTDGGNLFYNVGQVKFNPGEGSSIKSPGLEVIADVTVRKNLNITYKERDNYIVYHRLVTTDGITLEKGSSSFFKKSKSTDAYNNTVLSYTEGESILDIHFYPFDKHNPELWAKFAGIEFITKEEYDAAQVVK